MGIWGKLKHFSRGEAWGNSNKINGVLLIILDIITDTVKKYAWEKYKVISPCIIHCAYEIDGHSKNSQHYIGNAVDFHFKNISTKEVYEIIIQVLKDYQLENFVGLGIYPDWHNPGFHLDVRGYKARWSQVIGKYINIKIGIQKIKEEN